MTTFLKYLPPDTNIESEVHRMAGLIGVPSDRMMDVTTFLGPLKVKDMATYEHCLRVGLVGSALSAFIHLDPKVLFYSGNLHDVGKAQTRLSTLQKSDGWTAEDTKEIEPHVMDGYRMVRDKFDFTAEVILWHHRFQPNVYPKEIPPLLHDYSAGSRVMIPFYGRLLSLVDVYDALHRVNGKHGAERMDGEAMKRKMLEWNPDQRKLIMEAYEANIFTTRLFEEETEPASV